MGEPLRVLHVFRAPVGGLFRHVVDLTDGLLARGHAVGIACDSLTGNALTDRAFARLEPSLALGLTRLPMRRNPHLGDVAVLARLRRLIARTGAQVVHTHGAKGGVYGRLAAPRDRGVVTAYTPHGGSFNYRPGTAVHRLYMRVEGLLEARTDLLSFESAYVKTRFEAEIGAPRTLARVIYNGLHPAEFEPVRPDDEATDLLYIGEFRAAKGLDVLLDALALLKARTGAAPTMTFVGSGPDEGSLRERLAREGFGGRARVLGPRPAREAFRLGRLMLVPSRAESLPYVVLEAAAAGVPLVATRVGGVPEIFGPFTDGMIPPGDAEALAAAITADLARPEALRVARAAALTASVRRRFYVDGMVNEVLEGYAAAREARAPAPGGKMALTPA